MTSLRQDIAAIDARLDREVRRTRGWFIAGMVAALLSFALSVFVLVTLLHAASGVPTLRRTIAPVHENVGSALA